MLISRLDLENFRQYAGEQHIIFSEDPKKNVTLILGKNTSGKTTLIQAFRWVLYDDCNFTGKKNDQKAVLNSDVRKSMRPGDKKYAKVVLTFIHQGITYELKREYEYYSKMPGDASFNGTQTFILYYYPKGEKEVVRNGAQKLKEILPESLAEYFFFDGEKIAKSRDPDKVKDSINTIMGLVPLEHMLNHLSGRSGVDSVLRSSMKSDSGIDAINRKISQCDENIKKANNSKEESHRRFEDAASIAENKRVELEKVKGLAEAAAQLKSVDRSLGASKERIKSVEKDIISSFAPALMESIANYVSSDIIKSISEANYDDKGIPGMTAASINYILESGKCICGSDLNNDDCRAHLKELLTYLPPESMGTQISHLKKDLCGLKGANDKQRLFDGYCDSYNQQLENLEELEARQIELSDKVKDHRDADDIKDAYDNAIRLRNQFQADEVRYEAEVIRFNKDKDAALKNLESAAKADSYNKEILSKLAYVQALYSRASKEYDDNSLGIFDEIQSTLNTVFTSMYHGSRTIELTPDYKVRLTVGGERLDNSKGLDTVQNFAFIASLLKVAKDRANLDLNSEAYPLAMDAVFSNTDENHIRNICKELPKLAQQAVLALMDKDWDVASSSLDEYVGKKYRIEKISETHSELKEVL